MTRRSIAVCCGFALLAGLLIGSSFGPFSTTHNVHANAVNRADVETLYRELSIGRSSLDEGSRLLAKVAAATTSSVVHIQSERRNNQGGRVEETGSGVIITSPSTKGYFVVSNRHVVFGAELSNIDIRLHDGQTLNPTRIWSDEASDVAVMKIEAANLQAARWGNSDDVEIGHFVIAMGSPFGLSQSMTLGIISAKGRRALSLGPAGSKVINQDFLQTDAAINPGNSGGPLIDLHGRIIGINTAIASSSGGNEGIGFSIPSNLVKHVVEQLLQYERVRRAYLGVMLDNEFNLGEARRLKLERLRGARVKYVYPNTPASRSNLKYDDIVLTFDGIDVQDENHLINLVSLSPVGKRVRLVIFREAKRMTLMLTLTARPEEGQSFLPPAKISPQIEVDRLGLTLQNMDNNLARQLGYEERDGGLLVTSISSTQTNHNRQQFQIYDVIEEAARQPVANIEELRTILDGWNRLDPIAIKVQRVVDGESQSRVILFRTHQPVALDATRL